MSKLTSTQMPPGFRAGDSLPSTEEGAGLFFQQWRLREYLSILRHHFLSLLISVIVSLGLSIAVTSQQKKKYTAKVKLMMNTEPDPLRSGRKLFVSPSVIAQEIQTQIMVINSEAVLKNVILRNHPELRSSSRSADLKKEIDKLKKSLDTNIKVNSYIVELLVTDTDPDKAARLANMVAEQYIAFTETQHREMSRDTVEDLSAKLNKARMRLAKAQDNLRRFELSKGYLSYEDEIKIRMARLSRLSEAHTKSEREVSRLKTLRDYVMHLPSPNASAILIADLLRYDAQMHASGLSPEKLPTLRDFIKSRSLESGKARDDIIEKVRVLEAKIADLSSRLESLRAVQRILDAPSIKNIIAHLSALDSQKAEAEGFPDLKENLQREYSEAAAEYVIAVKRYVQEISAKAGGEKKLTASLGIRDGNLQNPPRIAEVAASVNSLAAEKQELDSQLVAMRRDMDEKDKRAGRLEKLAALLDDIGLESLEVPVDSARREIFASGEAEAFYASLANSAAPVMELLPDKWKPAFHNFARRLDGLVLDCFLEMKETAGREAVKRAQQQLWEAEDQLEKLRFSYEEGRPEIKEAQKRAERRLEKLREEITRVTGSIENDYMLATSEDAQIATDLEQHQERLKEFNNNRIEYEYLKGLLDTTRDEVERLNNLLAQSDLQSSIRYLGAYILEQAEAPSSPSSPKWMRNIFIGGVLGLGLGMMICFLLEYFDDTVREEKHLRDSTGMDVLCIVPRIPAEDGIEHKNVIAEILERPNSTASESFRMLRANISMAVEKPEGRAYRLLVTSALPNEGKTTVAANLAASLAKAGRKTLLIQADMRRPSDFSDFGVESGRGLAEALMNEAEPREFIVNSKQENLDMMPAGHERSMAGELVASEAFARLLDDINSSYDMIIIDSPPVTFISDARSIGADADGIVVVAHGGSTHIEDVVKTIQQLRPADTPILGTVINDLSGRVESYYRSRYYHRYRYGKRGYYYYHNYIKHYGEAEAEKSIETKGRQST